MKKQYIVIIAVIVIVAGGVAAYFWLNNKDITNQNANTNNNAVANINNNANSNSNTNVNENDNANDVNVVTNNEVTVEGTVFVKGYKTPSESYGILTTNNQEVGLGSYDSAREQFRIFVGDKVSVTFEKVCRSNHENCCRSLFFYCGTVKNYKSIK
ncbi:MAG: hypothetical protein WC734_04470 [Patescibacteria group bacterium]|jgi:hypothetical protein